MTTPLHFENGDLTYSVEIPEGQNVDAAVRSMEDSGWTRVENDDETSAKSAGAKNRKAQSAPSNPEGN